MGRRHAADRLRYRRKVAGPLRIRLSAFHKAGPAAGRTPRFTCQLVDGSEFRRVSLDIRPLYTSVQDGGVGRLGGLRQAYGGSSQ